MKKKTKPKTHKATAKRIKITSKKKIIQRRTHQNHFNARENSNKTRAKRGSKIASKTMHKKIKKSLPHSF